MSNLREHIQAARREHAAGRGTVLDCLLRSEPACDGELSVALLREAGVRILGQEVDPKPDFSRLSATDASALQALPFRTADSDALHLALADPWDAEALATASRHVGAIHTVWALTSAQLSQWLTRPSRQDQVANFSGEGLVVDFVNGAIDAAHRSCASDVHFECDRFGVSVKLRQDGVMRPFARLDDTRLAEEVISRIKVMAQLDITERRVPQDGRLNFRSQLVPGLDLRVSIMPCLFGEDAVLRLLDRAMLREQAHQVTLESLGFDGDSSASILELAALPHGMLLVTGPTGSGKTTTLYAVLSGTNSGQEKIITIEDPVEYELAGVLQIPVNERKGLTFARGLRSILRHDPDRILVGEIRDPETAEIAVQAALTGHQVSTTVHANSLLDVVSRFRHFGLDMHGFMSSLNGGVVQRLARRVCTMCAEVSRPSEIERQWLMRHGGAHGDVLRAVGCVACGDTGYVGRTVLAEVHQITDEFRDLVTSKAPTSELRRSMTDSCVCNLERRAATLIAQHVTTPKEIQRVLGWVL